VKRPRAGAVHPGMSAPRGDQGLVQTVGRPATGGELGGRVREGRSDRIVAADAFLLQAAEGLLIARINRGRAAADEQDRERMGEEALVGEAARDPRDVVVTYEGQRYERVEEAVVAVERMGQFEQVAVVKGAPGCAA
jgi:hypothetical protein